MILLFASSVFFVTAILSPVYIHNKFGIFSDLSTDDFLMLMSVGACVAVGLLVWEGIYIVRLIVKRSLSRYTRDEGNAGKYKSRLEKGGFSYAGCFYIFLPNSCMEDK